MTPPTNAERDGTYRPPAREILGHRDRAHLLRAFRQLRHYRALANSFATYVRPVDGLRRYVLGRGSYPAAVAVRTPIGQVAPELYSHHDMLTLNEVFVRQDYRADASVEVVVDFGSNIGLSALYFLSRNPRVRVHLFEPLARNIERLRRNLTGFEDRYVLHPFAVALADGDVSFGYEETGRYGGIGIDTGAAIVVPARSSTAALRAVLDQEGRIDVLKVDVEGLEKEILAAIPADMKRAIRQLYLETNFGGMNPYPDMYEYRQDGSIAALTRVGA